MLAAADSGDQVDPQKLFVVRWQSMPPELTAAELVSARALIALALTEDLGDRGDLTSRALIDPDESGEVAVVARQPGVVAGQPVARLVFDQLDPRVRWTTQRPDGSAVESGSVVATLAGPVAALLSGERTALNFVTHLSGIATLTLQFVTALAASRAKIYDTRKTLPGWRLLEKYAVRAGGGSNHRLGLYDGILIKDNHLAAWSRAGGGRSIAAAIAAARDSAPAGVCVEVEVDTLEQLRECLPARPDIVLLDNMSCEQMREAAAWRDARAPGVLLEASGGVTLTTVGKIGQTGVDRISSGALTHSAVALDLAFDWRN